MPSHEQVKAFIAMVENNQFVEAIETFYTEDASMQENLQPPRIGRATLVNHERQALASVKSIRTLLGSWFVMDGDRVVIHWVFEIENLSGQQSRLDELSHQRWVGDKILEERFYYDPRQINPLSTK